MGSYTLPSYTSDEYKTHRGNKQFVLDNKNHHQKDIYGDKISNVTNIALPPSYLIANKQ